MGPLLGAVKILLLAQAMQGTVAGRVWDAETAQPVPGAVVTLPELNRTAAADDSGRYVLRGIPAGPHRITIRFMGYAPRTLEALVPDRGPVEIDFWLLPEPVRIHSMDVHAPVVLRGLDAGGLSAFPDRVLSSTALPSDPLLAEPDLLQALGGGEIALRQESSSGINIRGGAADQTAYLIDGFPILNPYHAAGMTGAWNPDAIARLRVASAAPLETSPNALAGAVEAATRAPGDRIRAQGSASTTQSRITLDGPLGKAGYLVSFRSGFPDGIAPKHESSYIRGDTGDWLATLEAPVLGGRAQLFGYGNENDLNTAVFVAPDDGTPVDPRRNSFEWGSQSTGVRWDRDFAGAGVRVQGWRARGDISSAWAARTGPLRMGATRDDAGLLLAVERAGARAGTRVMVRVERSRTWYGIISDSTSGPTWELEANAPVATAVARHRHALSRSFTLNLGSSVTAARDRFWLGPSAQLLWKPSTRLELSGSHARTQQFAQSLRNPESVVGNVFPADLYVGAGASVPVARSNLSVLAATYRPHENLRLDVQGYERRSSHLLLVAPVEGEPFATTGAFAIGSATSHGASAGATIRGRRVGFVASYGLQSTRVEYGDASYVPESGARHTLEGGVILFPNRTTSVRLSAAAVLGRRGTAVTNGFEWEATNITDRGSEFGGSPTNSGALGGATLPGYYRLDLGIRKEWHLGVAGRDATIALFGTATNLLGRRNFLTYAPDPSTGEPAGVEMRPRAPLVVGLDWGF